MRYGQPEPILFELDFGGLIDTKLGGAVLSGGVTRLRAYGEMVDVLWRNGQQQEAIRLEELWNDLQARHSFTLLCAYAMASFYKEPSAYHAVCAQHTHVVDPAATHGDGHSPSLAPDVSRQLAKEIAQREEVEQALRESVRELRRKEEQLQTSERNLRQVTDSLPVLMAHVNADYRYTFVSAGYEKWFGEHRENVLGKTMADVLGDEAFATVKPYVERALAGESVTFEGEVPYRNGGTRFVEATYIPQLGSAGTVAGFVALVADITERKAHERFRTTAADRAERLLKITAAIADAVTSAQVFEAVVDQVAAVLGASSAGLWLVDEEGAHAKLVRSLGYQEAARKQFEFLPLDLEPSIPAIDAIRQGRAIWLTSQQELLKEYPHLGSAVTPGRAYSICCLPLSTRGRVLGSLGFTREDATRESTENRDFLLLVARYASQAIERLRLYEANAEARSRAELLYKFAQVLATADRVEQVFEVALDAIEGALGAHCSAILVFDDQGVMRFRAWHRLSDEYRQAVEGHSPWPRDAVAPQAVLVPDVETDDALTSYLPLFHREGIGSLAFIPLVSRGKLLGKFMVYYDRAHQYTPREIELASQIGNHLASVIARFAAISKLEETIHYNDLFAGILAHDLRNPLGAMMTATQLLLMLDAEGRLAEGVKPLGHILRSGQRMTRMIDQLLDVTHAKAGGGIQIQPCPANLADLCRQAVSELELANPKWKMHYEVHGDQAGSWDPDRLMQIFSNLVANAGQHGNPEEGVLITLDGRDANGVRFEIHNKGVIPESLLPYLFDPFRGTRLRRDHARGLGLGLFIVKEIARAHGGTVEAVSKEAGTTFIVTLPRFANARTDRHV